LLLALLLAPPIAIRERESEDILDLTKERAVKREEEEIRRKREGKKGKGKKEE
jgi:hypothetical protein